MGVRGLATLVDDNKNVLLADHKLHDTRVIIDGSNLYHFLYYHYHVAVQYGGDYDHYARKCKRFFNTLSACNIEPYVVFDGGYDPDDRKLPTVLERMESRRTRAAQICAKGRGCILPLLAYETFTEVLKELGVAHVSCVYEADDEIATLAHKWKCPVLSNDSDFFVYGIDGGYVPLDYMNLTLCVYNTETDEAMQKEPSQEIGKHEFCYIPVKFYHFEMFTKYFKKEDTSFILPLFATLTGNDFINPSELANFYSSIHVPKNPDKKGFRLNAQTHMLAVLYWLDCVEGWEKALQHVVGHLSSEHRPEMKNKLLTSFQNYMNIDVFSHFNVAEFLDSQRQISAVDITKPSMLPTMLDFDENALPLWFVERLRNCSINGLFLQNVAVNHRVIFNCQVENIRETSTFAISRDIRSVIYGIVTNMDTKADSFKDSRKNCVEEYDRIIKDTKKVYVRPKKRLSFRDTVYNVPSLDSLTGIGKNERKELLFSVLGLSSCEDNDKMDDAGLMFTGILAYWIKHAQPKVTESHLSAVLLCMIWLHVRATQWLDSKRSFGSDPVTPKFFKNIVCAIEETSEKAIENFLKHMEKNRTKPDHSSKNPHEIKVIHGFAHFQVCYLDAVLLNQVLLSPVTFPSPSVILNCMFVYNLCKDLETRSKPESYIEEILTRQSPLLTLFASWKDWVISLCTTNATDSFDEEKKAKSVRSKKKKAKSGKAKKMKQASEKEDKCGENTCEEDGECLPDLPDDYDVNNRFALLGLGD